MSACNPLVFSKVTVGIFQNIANAVTAKYGFPVVGNSGTQSKNGYTISWNFVPSQATLTIQCLAHPNVFGQYGCGFVALDIQGIASTFGLAAPKTVTGAHPAVPRLAARSLAPNFAISTLSASGAPLPPGACSPVVYNNITLSQFQSFAQALAARYNVKPAGPVGTATGQLGQQGLTLTWNFNAAANTLTIQITAHPALFSCSGLNSDLKSIAASLGLTGA